MTGRNLKLLQEIINGGLTTPKVTIHGAGPIPYAVNRDRYKGRFFLPAHIGYIRLKGEEPVLSVEPDETIDCLSGVKIDIFYL